MFFMIIFLNFLFTLCQINYCPYLSECYCGLGKSVSSQYDIVCLSSFGNETELPRLELFINRTRPSGNVSIDIEDRNLTFLPEFILRNFRLYKLDLSYNNILNISVLTFQSIRNVVHLDLSYNRIKSVENIFSDIRIPSVKCRPFNDLSILHMSYNQLEVLKSNTFNCLRLLRRLHINGNRLKHIEKGVFKGLSLISTLNNIELGENQLENINSEKL